MIFDNHSESDGRKHPMLHSLRRHITYANVAATLAVVFAMSGGAYAFSGGGQTSQTSALAAHSAKAKKRSKGSVGAQGPAGAQGSTGETGAGGSKGETGPAGPEGKSGKNGESVTSETLPAESGSGHCEAAGGTEFKIGTGTPTYACNGEPAPAGGGYPETLPEGRSEQGYWNASVNSPAELEINGKLTFLGYFGYADASFAIPLSSEQLGKITTHYVKKGEGLPEGCLSRGGGSTQPKAAPGNVCIFEETNIEAEPPSATANSGSGTEVDGIRIVLRNATKTGDAVTGSWVVAAPEG